MFPIELPAEVESRLEALARKTGRSPLSLAQDAILEHLDEMEDLEFAERELDEVRAGRLMTVGLAELLERYDVED